MRLYIDGLMGVVEARNRADGVEGESVCGCGDAVALSTCQDSVSAHEMESA